MCHFLLLLFRPKLRWLVCIWSHCQLCFPLVWGFNNSSLVCWCGCHYWSMTCQTRSHCLFVSFVFCAVLEAFFMLLLGWIVLPMCFLILNSFSWCDVPEDAFTCCTLLPSVWETLFFLIFSLIFLLFHNLITPWILGRCISAIYIFCVGFFPLQNRFWNSVCVISRLMETGLLSCQDELFLTFWLAAVFLMTFRSVFIFEATARIITSIWLSQY